MIETQVKNCPLISLKDALNKVDLIFKDLRATPTNKITIVKAMQYGNLHGTSYTALAALTEYKLLEQSGKDLLKLSSNALDLISLSKNDSKD